jgi:prepilin-type N-terminal cleavage/methylation domain-containing protein
MKKNGFILRSKSKPQRSEALGLSAKRESRGFTLAEIMVVIAVVAIMGTVLTEIFIRTFRASGKAQILATMKKNGEVILQKMNNDIRTAENITLCDLNQDANNDAIILENRDGTYKRYHFIKESISPKINGQVESDTPDLTNVLKANYCITPILSPAILSDGSSANGISIDVPDSGNFFSESFDNREVTIAFKVKPSVAAPSYGGQIDPESFQTTIDLR